MSRLTSFMFTFMICFMVAGTASATTYYIAANGSDANNGTSKTTPWLHAPGMPTCAGMCASATPRPGDRFIFRGGDTWHFGNSGLSPYVGTTNASYKFGWQWTWSGNNTNCNYPVVTTSCIYIGVDQSWFTDSAWTRPVLNLDNQPIGNATQPDSSHPGFVAACDYDDWNVIAVYLNASYLVMDNFNLQGKCWTQVPEYGGAAEIGRNGTFIVIINSYFHGWSEKYNPQSNGKTPMDQATIISGGGPSVSHNVVAYDLFDGSDSTCAGVNACTGGPALYGDAYDVHNSIFRYMANALNSPSNMVAIHDNLFEQLHESYDGADHGGVVESYGNGLPSGTASSFYNNIFRNTNMGVTLNVGAADNGTLYVFNNVFWNIGNSGNCIAFENNTANPTTMYVTNNTLNRCNTRFLVSGGPSPVKGAAHFQNNHFIGYSSQQFSSVYSVDQGTAVIVSDHGNEVYQTESAANAQGYNSSNNYAVTSGTGATIGAGANLSPSCPVFSADSALCSATSGAVTEGPGPAALPGIAIVPRVQSGAWSAGAYFTAVDAGIPSAPTNVVASVQ